MYTELFDITGNVLAVNTITRASLSGPKKYYYTVWLKDEMYKYFVEKNIKVFDEDEFPALIRSELSMSPMDSFLQSSDKRMYIKEKPSVATKIKLMF